MQAGVGVRYELKPRGVGCRGRLPPFSCNVRQRHPCYYFASNTVLVPKKMNRLYSITPHGGCHGIYLLDGNIV